MDWLEIVFIFLMSVLMINSILRLIEDIRNKSKTVISTTPGKYIGWLSNEQIKTADAWIEKHCDQKHPARKFGAIGGAFTYHITDTTLGQFVSLYCFCGEKLDLNNYDEF